MDTVVTGVNSEKNTLISFFYSNLAFLVKADIPWVALIVATPFINKNKPEIQYDGGGYYAITFF